MRIGITFLAIAFLCAPLAAEEATTEGQELFMASKCNLCHAVSTVEIEAKTTSDKMLGPDLVNLEQRHEDFAWLAQYVKQDAEMEGVKHKKGFKGTDEELQAILEWLAEQKTDE